MSVGSGSDAEFKSVEFLGIFSYGPYIETACRVHTETLRVCI